MCCYHGGNLAIKLCNLFMLIIVSWDYISITLGYLIFLTMCVELNEVSSLLLVVCDIHVPFEKMNCDVPGLKEL